jgi:hypothetical protein
LNAVKLRVEHAGYSEKAMTASLGRPMLSNAIQHGYRLVLFYLPCRNGFSGVTWKNTTDFLSRFPKTPHYDIARYVYANVVQIINPYILI